MADYFTHLSVAIDRLTIAEAEWVEAHLKDSTWELLGHEHAPDSEGAKKWRDERVVYEGDEESWPEFAWEIQDLPMRQILWLHDDAGVVNIDQLAAFVSDFLKRFRPDEVFKCTWADTCSKPRLDAFGGGALVVTANTWKTMTTDGMCDQLGKELADE